MYIQFPKHQIEEDALNVLHKSGALYHNVLPIDLFNVLESLNLQLLKLDFKNEEIDGAYVRSRKAIYVSDKILNESRVRFTIAHEIGHHVLHGFINDEILYRKKTSQNDVNIERQANWFAASLLMPKHLLDNYIELNLNLNELAVVFGVSKLAMSIRLSNYGYRIIGDYYHLL